MVLIWAMLILCQVWPKNSSWLSIKLKIFLVSAGFLIACAACSYFIVYSFFLIWRYEEPDDVPVEAEKTLDDVTKDRADTNGSKKEEFSSAL